VREQRNVETTKARVGFINLINHRPPIVSCSCISKMQIEVTGVTMPVNHLPVVQVTPVMMPMAGCDAMMVDAYRARNIHQAGQLSACG
jgi:hypothetical protein